MTPSELSSLVSAWQSRPEGLRYACATESELEKFEAVHGPIPPDFRTFLLHFGGGVVGTEWVDGIVELWETHKKFKAELGTHGWTLNNVFVIGWDGAGNPFGISNTSGPIVVEDHTFGGVHELAPSFEAFLHRGLSSAL